MKNITKDYLEEQYYNQNKSYADIAKELGTYPNKIARLAKKLGIQSRNRSEAQVQVVKRSGPPFAGHSHSVESKIRISETQSENWEGMSLEERERMSEVGKKNWAKLSLEQKELFRQKAFKAVKQASIEGSKLEKYLYSELVKAGYTVLKHGKHLIANQKVHLDLLLPNLATAIEVDGPSHFAPIWGAKSYVRAKRTDSEKDGLLLGAGYCLIRILQHRPLSEKYKRDIFNELIAKLKSIKQSFPPLDQRSMSICLGAEND